MSQMLHTVCAHARTPGRLRLNLAETLLIWLGSRRQLDKTNENVDTARDLGLIPDDHITMSAHVSSMCRSAIVSAWTTVTLLCICHLRGLTPASTSCAERCGTPLVTVSRRHDRITPIALATCTTASGIKARCHGLQGF